MKVLLQTLTDRYPVLLPCREDIAACAERIGDTFARGGKLLIAGNGGSAADAEHIVGELMKSFVLPRPLDAVLTERMRAIDPQRGDVLAKNLQQGLPAIALDGHPALSTAFQNDCQPQLVFAQQVMGYGREGDALLAISTSGNSENVLYAAIAAKAKGMAVIGLTGARESRLSALADICIRVPATETYQVQELHLPVYHALCMMWEKRFFGAG
ncbi:MAG: SIS domain-containing protein [Bacteroidales bacterium]|nr:SIS domain-containing protein [Bacteroidales bacterium]